MLNTNLGIYICVRVFNIILVELHQMNPRIVKFQIKQSVKILLLNSD